MAAPYVNILRGFELMVSFMTLAEMRQGALDANWGQRKREVLELYLAEFSVLHTDGALCSTWATVRNQRARIGRPIGSADAWIAASALVLSAPLVTNNPRDYEHLDDLRIVTLAFE
ncbi:MAG TPA: PIN domain-containing protein [Nitrospira sp.]|nr:PIN domain-containing protein [Nitrospira sp.]